MTILQLQKRINEIVEQMGKYPDAERRLNLEIVIGVQLSPRKFARLPVSWVSSGWLTYTDNSGQRVDCLEIRAEDVKGQTTFHGKV